MKSIGAEFLRPDALPGVNHMRGMQNQIVVNILTVNQLIQLYKFVCTINTHNSNIKLRCERYFSRLLRHTWAMAVMQYYYYITRYHSIIMLYYRFIVRFPIGLDFLFITFLLHFLLSWTSSLSISSLAISATTLSNHVFLGLPTGIQPSTLYSIHFFTQSSSHVHTISVYHL